ncbi:MAG: RidA family protein [Rhizobiaceae bacterium]|nr:RidA family protein [Rhizobiaceae bacterium]
MNKTHNPEHWPRPMGYSNAVSATGRMIFIAGQIGWNDAQEFESDDFVAQTRQALSNIKACLEAAGSQPAHIVRMTWYVLDKKEYLGALGQVGEVYREELGRLYPAMSLVEVSALVEDKARLEIEVTAVVPH